MNAKTMTVALVAALLIGAAPAVSRGEAPYTVAWSRQIGTSGGDTSRSVAVDAWGNAYISGYTNGSLGGTNEGLFDAFLTKYDASGNLLWSRQMGTTTYDRSYSVAVDASGNAYMTGVTSGSLGGTNAGGDDAFLTKYDGSGNLLWSRQMGTSGGDYSNSVAVDASGNAYISGETGGAGPSAGSVDAFLIKYDGSGNLLWSRQIGTSSNEWSESVAVDASGNAYISGTTEGSLGGANAGRQDVFLVKYDGSGNLLWSRQMGTTTEQYSWSVTVDALCNAYISGWTQDSFVGPSAGVSDAFLIKYDGSGNLLWSQQIGTSSDDWSFSVAVDALCNAYITGWTYGSLGGTNAGYSDAFLVKFVPEPGSAALIALGALAVLRRRRNR
jgi:hypothetical protein